MAIRDGQPFQTDAPAQALQINPRAFRVPGKTLLGLRNIAVDLPAAACFTVLPAAVDEALYVFRRVAEKEADFMGKGIIPGNAAGKAGDAGLRIGGRITESPEKLPRFRAAEGGSE